MSGVAKKSLGTPADHVKAQNVVVTDSEDDAVTRSGTWTQVEHPSATDLTYVYSATSGDYLEFKFKGTGLWLRFFSLPDGGKANVSIDGGTAKVLDMYSATERLRIAFVASNLTATEHTVKIEVTANQHVLSSGYKIAVDAFIVELSRGAMQIWAMLEESIVAQVIPGISTVQRTLSLPWWARYTPERILYLDDFEGVLKFDEVTGTVAKVSDLEAFEGSNSLKLTTGASAGNIAGARIWLGYVPRSKMALTFRWHAKNAADTTLRVFYFHLQLFDGSYRTRFELAYEKNRDGVAKNRWTYVDENAADVAVPGGDQVLYTRRSQHNFFRAVLDFSLPQPEYVSLEANELLLDLTGLKPIHDANTTIPALSLTIYEITDVDVASIVYVDALILSDQEP